MAKAPVRSPVNRITYLVYWIYQQNGNFIQYLCLKIAAELLVSSFFSWKLTFLGMQPIGAQIPFPFRVCFCNEPSKSMCWYHEEPPYLETFLVSNYRWGIRVMMWLINGHVSCSNSSSRSTWGKHFTVHTACGVNLEKCHVILRRLGDRGCWWEEGGRYRCISNQNIDLFD